MKLLGQVLLGLGVALAAVVAARAAEPVVPFDGCYIRIYDPAFLKAHHGQIVRHVRLKIGPTAVSKPEAGEKRPVVADATLQIWTGAGRISFDSIGACWLENGALLCNGSESAAEAKRCATKDDGVRNCRMADGGVGSFMIEKKPEGLLVTIRERLEMPQTGSDSGPYLYLSPENPQNHGFLLKAAPCK